jgi:CTP synthase (UTP-ammonia lyase)
VLGLTDAQSEEEGILSQHYLIVPVSCPAPNRVPGAPKLSGRLPINLCANTRIHSIYGRESVVEEEYFCNYAVNPEFQEQFHASGLQITSRDGEGVARSVELPHHRFFLATLFQPQLSSDTEKPHPIVVAFLKAAIAFQQREST